ncbi:MAG: hypothetical protein ACLPLP_15380 [Mycobacterium sp.]
MVVRHGHAGITQHFVPRFRALEDPPQGRLIRAVNAAGALGGHGPLHRGLEIKLVRVTGSPEDGASGGIDQKRPSALERGSVATDPVDLLVFGVIGDRPGRYRQHPRFRGLLAHESECNGSEFNGIAIGGYTETICHAIDHNDPQSGGQPQLTDS